MHSLNDRLSQYFDRFILTLIVGNVAALVFGTVEDIYSRAPFAFQAFEAVSVAIFSLEYGLRIWAITADPRYRSPLRGRLRFASSPVMLVDLAAILPFYLLFIASFFGLDLRALRILRLLARIARAGPYSNGLSTLARVARAKRAELTSALVILSVLLLVTSSLVYIAEHEAQPDQFPDIPHAMWWSMITLTTIGYGDVYPITMAGRLLAAASAVLGLGLFALPAGILGAGFVDELQAAKRDSRTCPHCGRAIEE
ncbi:MAG: potassium channel family protein [Chloroflexota bacterium]|nr:potassium channel family protein [Chloroflexota bacterium]